MTVFQKGYSATLYFCCVSISNGLWQRGYANLPMAQVTHHFSFFKKPTTQCLQFRAEWISDGHMTACAKSLMPCLTLQCSLHAVWAIHTHTPEEAQPQSSIHHYSLCPFKRSSHPHIYTCKKATSYMNEYTKASQFWFISQKFIFWSWSSI